MKICRSHVHLYGNMSLTAQVGFSAMSDTGIIMLAGDRRRRESKLWEPWLRQVPPIRRKFGNWAEDFDPFHYNEAASVAVLANAASRAGYLAHTEYVAAKRHITRGRPFRPGRCDLWIADVKTEMSWAFEVKQHFAAAKIRQSTFDKRLARARDDALQVDSNEAEWRVGCLVMVPSGSASSRSELIPHYDELCKKSEFAYRIGGGVGSIWLAFVIVH